MSNSNDSSINENSQNDSHSHVLTFDRIASAGQPIVQPRTSEEQLANESNSVSSVAMRVYRNLPGAAMHHAISHPLSYVQILIQIGYEPLPAYRGRTLFGKEALYYPNAFRYLKYVYNVDGFTGLYRGVGCSLLSTVTNWYAIAVANSALPSVEHRADDNQTKSEWNAFVEKVLRKIHTQSWGILVSHPFHVMAIRCMGQFIGREQKYSSINIFKNAKEIYEHQGIGGFFVGFMPRWLLEVSGIVITNFIFYLIKTVFPTQYSSTWIFEYVATFITQTATYPLHILTTVTAINRSGLRAGMLPITPIYVDWHDAYSSLKKAEQLKRGSSLFNRGAPSTNNLVVVGSRK